VSASNIGRAFDWLVGWLVGTHCVRRLCVADNRVFGWGTNRALSKISNTVGPATATHSLLGLPGQSDFVPPTELPGIEGCVISIACGDFHSVIVTCTLHSRLD